jgi:hypothetical protein
MLFQKTACGTFAFGRFLAHGLGGLENIVFSTRCGLAQSTSSAAHTVSDFVARGGGGVADASGSFAGEIGRLAKSARRGRACGKCVVRIRGGGGLRGRMARADGEPSEATDHEARGERLAPEEAVGAHGIALRVRRGTRERRLRHRLGRKSPSEISAMAAMRVRRSSRSASILSIRSAISRYLANEHGIFAQITRRAARFTPLIYAAISAKCSDDGQPHLWRPPRLARRS